MKTIKYLHVMVGAKNKHFLMSFDDYNDAMLYLHEEPEEGYAYSIEVSDQRHATRTWDAENELNDWRQGQGLPRKEIL